MITQQQFTKIIKVRNNFLKEYAKIKYYPFQTHPSNATLWDVFNNNGGNILNENSRQSGKTTGICGTASFLLTWYHDIMNELKISMFNEFNIIFFAPQKEQAKTDFDKVRDILDKCKGDLGFDYKEANGNTLRLEFFDEQGKTDYTSTAFCFSLSPTSNPESKTGNLIIFEEAQDMMDFKIDKTANPMGTATNATTVYIGTAGYELCRFKKFIDELPKEYRFVYDCHEIIKQKKERYKEDNNPFHLNYEKYIKKQLRDLGADSDEYKTQYLLKWILSRGQFITYKQLMSLQADYDPISMYGEICYGGIDWGKAHDRTVFKIVDENARELNTYEFSGDDYGSQVDQISMITPRFPRMRILHCDSTGTQDQVVDWLKRKVRVPVEGVKMTLQAKDMMYKNLHKLMHPVRDEKGNVLEPARYKWPRYKGSMLSHHVNEFRMLQKEIKTGLWSCHHPEGSNYHDDYTDAAALACIPISTLSDVGGAELVAWE